MEQTSGGSFQTRTRLIIFDFDGVILDSAGLKLDAYHAAVCGIRGATMDLDDPRFGSRKVEVSMRDEVFLDISGHIAELVLNRPSKLNAITPKMAEQIDDLCRAADRDPDVRVILLRGEGDRAFCSGSDINALLEYPSSWRFRNRIEYATAVRNLRKPVVAALHGWVLGGGAELAVSADIRFTARDAKIGFPEVSRGWVGGGGASQLLPRLIGYGQAMRLLLSGDIIGADEAFRLGLVEFVVDREQLLSEARTFCARLAGYSPVAVEAAKAAVRAALNTPLAAGILYENEMNTLCLSAGDQLEGIHAFRDRRRSEP